MNICLTGAQADRKPAAWHSATRLKLNRASVSLLARLTPNLKRPVKVF